MRDRKVFCSLPRAIGGVIGRMGMYETSEPEGESTMAQAHIWQLDPEPIADIVGEEVADIVVVGAGIAGCTAAQSAAEAGASVIVIEKFDKY